MCPALTALDALKLFGDIYLVRYEGFHGGDEVLYTCENYFVQFETRRVASTCRKHIRMSIYFHLFIGKWGFQQSIFFHENIVHSTPNKSS